MNATEATQWGIVLNAVGSILIAPDILRQVHLDDLAARLQQKASASLRYYAAWAATMVDRHPGVQTPSFVPEDGYSSKPWRSVMAVGAIVGALVTTFVFLLSSEQ